MTYVTLYANIWKNYLGQEEEGVYRKHEINLTRN